MTKVVYNNIQSRDFLVIIRPMEYILYLASICRETRGLKYKAQMRFRYYLNYEVDKTKES